MKKKTDKISVQADAPHIVDALTLLVPSFLFLFFIFISLRDGEGPVRVTFPCQSILSWINLKKFSKQENTFLGRINEHKIINFKVSN